MDLFARHEDVVRLGSAARDLTEGGALEIETGRTVWALLLALPRVSQRNFEHLGRIVKEAGEIAPNVELVTAGLERIERVRQRVGL